MSDKRVSTRQLDIILEQSVAKFMDEFFYSKLTKEKGISCRRIYDKPAQLLGIDAVIGKFCIDEKVKIKGGYISKVIEYPSFEISMKSQKSGSIIDGWFVKPELKTDYYAFITVFSKETDWMRIRYENIEKLVVLFVHKKSLLNYLGWNTEELKAKADELRKNSMVSDRKDFDGYHLKISLQFPEEPVNLVMRRSTLLSIDHTREVEVNRKFFMELI